MFCDFRTKPRNWVLIVLCVMKEWMTFCFISVTQLSLSVFSFCNKRTTRLVILLNQLGKSTFFSGICLEFKGVVGQPERWLSRQRH